MRKFTATVLVFLLIPAVALSGCVQSSYGKDDKISVICTIFPLYDWVRQITENQTENIDLTLLSANLTDLHNYQPSVDDIVRISGCDLFIHVGGESDGWVDDALKQATNKNMVVINLLDILGDAVKIEEIIEGMETGEAGSGKHNAGDVRNAGGNDGIADIDGGSETDYDEHIWLSLRNAQVSCSVITEALSSMDAGNADIYGSNCIEYSEKLSNLDSEYRAVINTAPVRILLFADRFPFRYLTDDYGLSYYAAFQGCSAETEVSFGTIIFLMKKLDELDLSKIMVTESSDKKLAETIIRESNSNDRQILVLDAMQSVSSKDLANGVTYLSIMESNLNVLKEALGG